MFKIITIEELLKILDGYNYKELHMHHTWKPRKTDYNGINGLELQAAMRKYHIINLGWTDLGQHITALPDGLFVTGRDFGQTPASILGHNTGAFACEILGDFDKGQEVLEGKQLESILELMQYFDKKGKYIRFHRENSSKTCPGSGIDKDMLIAQSRAYMNNNKIKPAPIEGNPNVRKIQELCNEGGFKDNWSKELVVDGLWGSKTECAVPTIKKGSDLKYFVQIIQRILLAKGYKLPKYGADKDFGNETLAAVKQFQKDNHLVADGIVGKLTWAKLLA